MEEDHEIVVDVELSHLSESIVKKLDTLGQPTETDNSTIFPVPYKFRQSKENLFEPSVVSIGPFHRDKESVKATEEQKWRILRDFLSRGDHISLDLCLSEIKKLEERTRRCYNESVPLDSNSFVLMMLLDGCFVLDYFLKWYERRLYCINHDVFVHSDLLRLENQIPFFIVEKLFEIGINRGDRMDFTNYLVNIFARAGPAVLDDSIVRNPPAQIHHFVHLCYHLSSSRAIETHHDLLSSRSFRPSMRIIIKYFLLGFFLWVLRKIFTRSNSPSLSFPKSTRKRFMLIPCATELQNAGIKLIPNSSPDHMLDISFDHGVLQIPTLTITNESKTILANLIAFEQYKLSNETSANLSSFALFFDSLVNTPKDVMLLQKCGILNNYLDSEEELTDFFNQICKGTVLEKYHYFDNLSREVNKYCESSWSKRRARWNKYKTEFIHEYFRRPWTAISLVAAVVVVLLTCAQSLFTIYAYFVPPR